MIVRTSLILVFAPLVSVVVTSHVLFNIAIHLGIFKTIQPGQSFKSNLPNFNEAIKFHLCAIGQMGGPRYE